MMQILLIVFTVLMSTSYANDNLDIKSKYIFAGVQAGTSVLTTNESNEAGEKTGHQYGVMSSVLLKFNSFDFNTGLSYYFLNFESERVNNVKYDLETKTLAYEVSPLWNFKNNFSFGPKLQVVLTEKILVGPSDKENESSDSLTTNMVIGVNAFYSHDLNKYKIRYGLHLHKPYDIGNRDANILLFSIEIGQLIK